MRDTMESNAEDVTRALSLLQDLSTTGSTVFHIENPAELARYLNGFSIIVNYLVTQIAAAGDSSKELVVAALIQDILKMYEV